MATRIENNGHCVSNMQSKNLDIDEQEQGYLRMLLRMDEKLLGKKHARLLDKFGNEADVENIETKLDINARLQAQLKKI